MNNETEPTIWLRGRTAGLGPYVAGLVDKYWAWEQDPTTLVGYGRPTPESLEARREGFERQARGTNNVRFTVYDVREKSPTPVGTTSVRIDSYARTGEFVIQLHKAARGYGIGTDAAWLTLDYAFHVSNLRCVYLTALSPNKAAIRAYEKAGFRVIGERRQSGYWLGERVNETLMDAVPEDFEGESVVAQLMQAPQTLR